MNRLLSGLVAATHTPFDASGELNLSVVERQAEHLLSAGVSAVFIGGSTGECHSLAVEERLALAERWSQVVRGTTLRLVIHVGANCLRDARLLAKQAQTLDAAAIAALAPSYFKPKSLDALIECCREIGAAAPAVPFFFYDIPSLTGVQFSMPELLEKAPARIPTFAGIKFTNPDLMAFQRASCATDGRFEIAWGIDEYLLAALALGASAAVGSSYNFAAPLYVRLMTAVALGDLPAARDEQFRSVRLIELLARFGYMAAAKATMEFLGVPVGPARLPHSNLSLEQREQLRTGLDDLNFFDWVDA